MSKNIKFLAKIFTCLIPLEVWRQAYAYAEQDDMRHMFNREKNLAGKDWLHSFLMRKPLIGIYQRGSASIKQVTALCKQQYG